MNVTRLCVAVFGSVCLIAFGFLIMYFGGVVEGRSYSFVVGSILLAEGLYIAAIIIKAMRTQY